MVDVLASLAAETADDLSRDVTLEDVDAILSQVVMPLSAEDRREIAEESLEMSQRVWDEDVQPAAAVAGRGDKDDDDDNMYVIQLLIFVISFV